MEEMPRILVVEGETDRLNAFEGLFRSLGCDVILAASPEKALEELERGIQCDIIVFNLNLSGMDSNQFLRRLEARSEWKDIPLVPFSIYLEYKFTERERSKIYLLSRGEGVEDQLMDGDRDAQLSRKMVDVIIRYIGLVPGEIVEWAAYQLQQHGKELPLNFKYALEIFEKRREIYWNS